MNNTQVAKQFLDTISDLYELGFKQETPGSGTLDVVTFLTPDERKARILNSILLHEKLIKAYPQYDYAPSGILDMLSLLMLNSSKTHFHIDRDIYDMFWEDRNELAQQFSYNICEKQRHVTIESSNLVS